VIWVVLVLGVFILAGGLAAAIGPAMGAPEIAVLTALVVVALFAIVMAAKRRQAK
jgi:hypothetical protein